MGTIAAKVRDGCGHLLSDGNLFLVDSQGQPVFLHHRKDQSWHGSWKVDDAAAGNHRLDADWMDGASGRRASNWIQVTVLP